MLLVGVPTSYAIHQKVVSAPMSKKSAFLLSLWTWGFAALGIILAVVFPKYFWEVFLPWCIVFFTSRFVISSRFKNHLRPPISENPLSPRPNPPIGECVGRASDTWLSHNGEVPVLFNAALIYDILSSP